MAPRWQKSHFCCVPRASKALKSFSAGAESGTPLKMSMMLPDPLLAGHGSGEAGYPSTKPSSSPLVVPLRFSIVGRCQFGQLQFNILNPPLLALGGSILCCHVRGLMFRGGVIPGQYGGNDPLLFGVR